MARFIALVGWEGPVPDDYADQPTPGARRVRAAPPPTTVHATTRCWAT